MCPSLVDPLILLDGGDGCGWASKEGGDLLLSLVRLSLRRWLVVWIGRVAAGREKYGLRLRNTGYRGI